jgi:polar amino acid transport system permease protein
MQKLVMLKRAQSSRPAAGELSSITIEPRSHSVRFALGVLVILSFGIFFYSVVTNESMRWDVVGEYLFATPILKGLVGTIALTIIAMSVGIILGVILEVVRATGGRIFQRIVFILVNFTRSVPLLVQLIFWFNVGIIFPRIAVGIPFTPLQVSAETNVLISGFTASIIGLALHESALMAEIIRGGILSVPKGQPEAARTLGIPEYKVFGRIVLPLSMRAIIPATMNQLINLMKATAMVAFIAGGDLMTAAQKIYSRNFLVIPLLVVVTVWYLVLTLTASVAQRAVEKRFSRGFTDRDR